MGFEELRKSILDYIENNKESKELDNFLKEIGYMSNEDVEGLKKKNYELIGKIKKLKNQMSELETNMNKQQDDGDDGDGEGDDNQDKQQVNQFVDKKLKAQLDKMQREIEKYKMEAEEAKNRYKSAFKERKLLDILNQNDIDKAHHKILIKAMSNDFDVEDNELYYKDGERLIPAEDFFKEWVEKEGVYYKATKPNKGAMPVSDKSNGAAVMSRTEFEQLPADKKMEVVKKGYQITD